MKVLENKRIVVKAREHDGDSVVHSSLTISVQ